MEKPLQSAAAAVISYFNFPFTHVRHGRLRVCSIHPSDLPPAEGAAAVMV